MLKRLFRRRDKEKPPSDKVPLKDDIIEKVIHQAPNAAYDYIITLYKNVQNKE